MKFTKMHGCGNDFVIVDMDTERIRAQELPELARRLCARRTSVGADGLMAVTRTCEGADFRMIFYNADGTEGEMCGNGARCICRYGYEHGLAGETQHVETISGTVIGQRISPERYRVRLNDPSCMDLKRTAVILDQEISAPYIELGVPGLPHAVVEVPDLEKAEENALREFGRALRWSESFPAGANVNLY